MLTFNDKKAFICCEQVYCINIFLKTSSTALVIPFCEVIWSYFCQAVAAGPMKNGGPYFDIFTHNIAVINTSMI